MTPRQRAFADEFLKCGNAAQAAREAGYSPKTARSQGQRLLTNGDIKALIGSRLDVLEAQRTADATEVIEFLSRVMRGQEKDQFGLDASLQDRIKAAQLLLRRFDAADGQHDTLVRLDGLLIEFRQAIDGGGK